MTSFIEKFSRLRRPGILIRAAQHYLTGKNRPGTATLRSRQQSKTRTDSQLLRLIDDEHYLEEVRRTNSAEYSIKAHIEILADIIAAAQALRTSRPAVL